MTHTNVTNLDPQRIKESDDRKWERKLFDFAMTLSENEIQLVEEFLSIRTPDLADFNLIPI